MGEKYLTESYDLELGRVVGEIRKQGARRVCIQLPDGLKPCADRIARHIKKETGAEVLIWAGSCFGACDIPGEMGKLEVDLLIQFGHSEWRAG